MLTVRCRRRPDRGIPWVEVTRRVSQEFRDAFHSAREDQSDMASDSDSETEDWDDIVAYDTETSRYTTVVDDWRSDVDNYVGEGHPTRLIRLRLVCTRGMPSLHRQNGDGLRGRLSPQHHGSLGVSVR